MIHVDNSDFQSPRVPIRSRRVIEVASVNDVTLDHAIERVRECLTAVPGNAFPADLRTRSPDRVGSAIAARPFSSKVDRDIMRPRHSVPARAQALMKIVAVPKSYHPTPTCPSCQASRLLNRLERGQFGRRQPKLQSSTRRRLQLTWS